MEFGGCIWRRAARLAVAAFFLQATTPAIAQTTAPAPPPATQPASPPAQQQSQTPAPPPAPQPSAPSPQPPAPPASPPIKRVPLGCQVPEAKKFYGELLAKPGIVTKPVEVLPGGAVATVDLGLPFKDIGALRLHAVALPVPKDAADQTTEIEFEQACHIINEKLLIRGQEPADRSANMTAQITVPAPDFGFWPKYRFFIMVLDPKTDVLQHVIKFDTRVSSHAFSVVVAIGLVVLFYWALGLLARRAELTRPKDGSYFHPLTFVGTDCGASLGRLQILFFTFIVAGMISYILLRTGILTDLSPDVLKLLGIAALGTVVAAAADNQTRRLKMENWAWLTNRGWLPLQINQNPKPPEWRDLLVSGGEFNVYRFQMLVFSAIVGASLLTIGLTELATYKIPEALLGVLGLSQVVYVLGKAVAPPTIGDLEKSIEALRAKDLLVSEKAGLAAKAPDAEKPKLEDEVKKMREAFMEEARIIYEVFKAAVGQIQYDHKPPATPSDAMLKPSIDLAAVRAAAGP